MFKRILALSVLLCCSCNREQAQEDNGFQQYLSRSEVTRLHIEADPSVRPQYEQAYTLIQQGKVNEAEAILTPLLESARKRYAPMAADAPIIAYAAALKDLAHKSNDEACRVLGGAKDAGDAMKAKAAGGATKAVEKIAKANPEASALLQNSSRKLLRSGLKKEATPPAPDVITKLAAQVDEKLPPESRPAAAGPVRCETVAALLDAVFQLPEADRATFLRSLLSR